MYHDVTWTVNDAVEDLSPTSIDNEVRISVLEFACAMGDRDCLKEAKRIFMDWLLHEKLPHPDIRELVYYYG